MFAVAAKLKYIYYAPELLLQQKIYRDCGMRVFISVVIFSEVSRILFFLDELLCQQFLKCLSLLF